MRDRFDRELFATVLLALALLISVSSVARFPNALRTTNPLSAARAAGVPVAAGAELTLR